MALTFTNLVTTGPTFQNYPNFGFTLQPIAQIYKQEGDISYSYSPFRNIQDAEGNIKDFITDKLNFNLRNPVNIEIQPSYDGSVNLILNDDLNPPRIINSRFTVVEDKRFKIIDRKGTRDTNIYSEDDLDLDTRLFKNLKKIPFITFNKLIEGGQLEVGNYTFYFKYTDADGNESDIITESGIIPIFLGNINDPFSISGGILNENSNKIIDLTLNNLDTSYDYINVYYTRSTGSNSLDKTVTFNRIIDRKIITDSKIDVTITGFEQVIELPMDNLNIEYNIVTKVKTQAQVQNMLFFGNVDKPTIEYKELEDLSLHILPYITNTKGIGYLDQNYTPVSSIKSECEYYNVSNVYNLTGFWNNEIYRLGICYILPDDTISPVFNIRGALGVNNTTASYTPFDLVNSNTGIRSYIPISENGFLPSGSMALENTKGVIQINYTGNIISGSGTSRNIYPLSVNFEISDAVLTRIKTFAKGFFFVRQKRIPTILAQGLTIGYDGESYLPCLPTNKGYVMESFIDTGRLLVYDWTRHAMYKTTANFPNIKAGAILSPELSVNEGTRSLINNSNSFVLSNGFFTNNLKYLTTSASRSYHVDNYTCYAPNTSYTQKNKLLYVNSESPLKYNGTKYYSSKAGDAQEAWRLKYFGTEDLSATASNLVRGIFTDYIGCDGYIDDAQIINIHTPGFDYGLMEEYFKIRFNSFYSFYTMSNRYDLKNLDLYSNHKLNGSIHNFEEYRGDCYVNTVTVRMNRNFQDPEVPISDIIVEDKTWKDHYRAPKDYTSDTKLDNTLINRGDVNSVPLGHWATFKVCSTLNLSFRSMDEYNVSETAITGQPRGFHPLFAKSPKSESKIAESLIYNSGYSSTTGEKNYTPLPDVPYLKNIFDNRIIFSAKHVNDAFQNGFRVFQGLSYQDITRQYGAITKIFDWQGNLLCVFENGVALLAINERALIQSEAGQSIHMYGSGVLPDKESPISIDFGSRWIESIIRTPAGIYGVDTEAKKIWRFGSEGFQILSDFKIQKFLNDNIDLDPDEYQPLIGLRNVKTHFNAFKGDVIFTFYNCTKDQDKEWSIVYNERINKWVTKYSWIPLVSENINNIYFSFDKHTAENLALNAYTLQNNAISDGIVLSNNVIDLTIGTLSLKGYDYYSEYTKVFTIDAIKFPQFSITNTGGVYTLHSLGATKDFYKLEIECILTLNGVTAPQFIDYIYVYKSTYIPTTGFFKHGQAGTFLTQDTITPCFWYDKQELFEFEFIVNDNPAYHKIFNNLKIISNNAEPDSITVSVVGDIYDFKNVITDNDFILYDENSNTSHGFFTYDEVLNNEKSINSKQKIRHIGKNGIKRLNGNAMYLEDKWDIEIRPLSFNYGGKRKEARLRDKYAKIRVSYKGNNLAIITGLQTLYTMSYA